jgi:hypothetical protein
MRRTACSLALFLAFLPGCAEKPDPFKGDKITELRYLRRLSNPTPDQYLRIQELNDDKQTRDTANGRDAFDEMEGKKIR